MSVERLTSKRDWTVACKDLMNEYGYSSIWFRLQQIEDILGDTYDLERLRGLVWHGLGESVTESEAMNRPFVRDTKTVCECACSTTDRFSRLNREAWGPCSLCGVKVCENCFYGNTPACSECENCYMESNWKPESKYCPGCGRPLTEEAWAMLEKRLEGIE